MFTIEGYCCLSQKGADVYHRMVLVFTIGGCWCLSLPKEGAGVYHRRVLMFTIEGPGVYHYQRRVLMFTIEGCWCLP